MDKGDNTGSVNSHQPVFGISVTCCEGAGTTPSHFLKFYFILQYRRTIRELKAMGALPVLAFGLVLAGFLFASVALFRKVPATAPYLYPLAALLVCFMLNEKEKNEFLQSVFSNARFLLLRSIENMLAAIPFALFLVYKKQFVVAVSTILVCLILARIRVRPSLKFQIPSPFSKRPYEFTTGFRRNYLLILIFYICSFTGLWYHNYNLGIVLTLGLFLTVSTFYSQLDPVYYVWIYALSGKQFIKTKMKTALLYGVMIAGPLFLPMLLIYPMNILFSFMVLLIGLLIIGLAVLGAYVSFPSKMTLSQQIQFYLGIFFPPALLFVIPNFYGQAVNRLKEYLKC